MSVRRRLILSYFTIVHLYAPQRRSPITISQLRHPGTPDNDPSGDKPILPTLIFTSFQRDCRFSTAELQQNAQKCKTFRHFQILTITCLQSTCCDYFHQTIE